MRRWMTPRRAGLATILLLAMIESLAPASVSAQTSGVQVQLMMSPNPSPYLSDWEQRSETVFFRVTNTTLSPITFRIDTKIYREGELKAETKLQQMPVLTLEGPGTALYNAEDIIRLQAMTLYGEGEQTIVRSGRIPAGFYQICTRLVQPNSGEPISQDACAFFTATGYQLPQLQLPPDNVALQPEQPINFAWTPVVPEPPVPPRYVLRVFEVLPGQAPMTAFRANSPILEAESFGVPGLFWPPEIPGPEPGMTFVWSVQTLDGEGRPLADPDGYASPFTFSTTTTDHGTEVSCRPGACSIQGVTAERVETTPSAPDAVNSTGGAGVALKIQQVAECPPGCPPQIEVRWMIRYATADGRTGTVALTGETVMAPLPPGAAGPVRLSIDLETTVRCGNAEPSTCSGSFEEIVDGGGGSITDDDVDTVDAQPPTMVVDEPPLTPVDSIPTGEACIKLPYSRDRAMAISLGMILDQPDLFQYPRAVPIRADAIDIDYAIFKCLDCDGSTGEYWKPIPDDVRSYSWSLDGKGSLNVPFDLAGMADAEESIAEIAARLQEITASLDSLKSDTAATRDRLEKQRKDALPRTDEAKAGLDSITGRLGELRDSLKSAGDSLKVLVTLRSKAVKSRRDSLKRADAALKSLDSLDLILRGTPTPAERAKLDELKSARASAADADESVARKTKDIQTEADRWKTAIDKAAAELDAATLDYEDLKRGGESEAKKVSAAQTALYGSHVGRSYFEARRAWDMAAVSFINLYLPHHQAGLSAEMTTIDKGGEDGLSTAVPLERAAALTLFRTRMAAVKKTMTCTGVADPPRKSACEAELPSLLAAAAAYDRALDAALASSYKLSPALLVDMATARGLLSAKEGAIGAAARTVERKSDAYEAALRDYGSSIGRLETERTALLKSAAERYEKVGTLEKEYQEMVKIRETDLEQKRESYLAEQHRYESLFNAMNLAADLLRDTIARIDVDTLLLGNVKERLERERSELEEEKSGIGDLLDRLKKIIDMKPADLMEDAVAAMKRLETERKELEEKLKELTEKRGRMAEGNKKAEGALVYYIPPPLEEIISDTSRFERLKDSVMIAERGVVAAREFRAGLQGRLVRELDRVARELTTSRKAAYRLERLREEAKTLERELASLKNEKTLEYNDVRNRLLDILDRNREHQAKAEEYLKRAAADSAALAARIDEIRKRVEALEEELKKFDVDLLDLRAQLDYEEGARQKAKNTLTSRLADLQKGRRELQELEDDLARAQNGYTRAVARSNIRSESGAASDVAAKKSAVAAKKSAIAGLESGAASAAESFDAAGSRVTAAEKSLAERSKDLLRKQGEFRAEQDELIRANQEMEELLTGLNYWRMVLEKAGDEIEKCNAARDMFREKIEDDVNADEGVVGKDAERKEVEKRIAEAEAVMKKAEAEIAAALKRRDEHIGAAKDTVTAAERSVNDARDALRAFLLHEFNHIRLIPSLTVTADDAVLDGFRSDDDRKELTLPLTYGGSRIPSLASIYPTGSVKPIEKKGLCNPEIPVMPTPDIVPTDPSLEMTEPRTIALIYGKGEPLWPEWPVIPGDAPILTDDVVRLIASGGDADVITHICVSGNPICPPPLPTPYSIADLVTYTWSGEGAYVNGAGYRNVLWKTIDVPDPDCTRKGEVKTKYFAGGIATDTPVERLFKPEVAPGVLIETPDSLVGSPGRTDTLRARVVKGDHKGRPGEKVEFTVTLVEGEATEYGFDGSAATVTKTTDADGYAKAEFNYGRGFARFRIEAKWKRGKDCKVKEIAAISPLHLKSLRFTSGAPTVAWDAAKEVWGGATAATVLEGMPEGTDSAYEAELFAVAGFHDYHGDSVNGEEVFFEPKRGFAVEPASVETALFGIGRTVILDPPEKGELTLTSRCDTKYEKVCRPPSVDGAYNSTKVEKFRIGSPGDPFVIIPEEPIVPGEAGSGTGRIEVDAPGRFIRELKGITVTISDVELEEVSGDEIPTALKGSVTWAPEGTPFTIDLFGFAISLESLTIRAGSGAGIGGSVGHAKLERPVAFTAEMNTRGEFYGEVASLPQISIAKFTLKEGTSFALDMHPGVSDKGLADDFQGIVIREAALELPPVFNGREGAPSALKVSDFRIGKGEGVAGSVALDGAFFSIGYAGYQFQADRISLTFADSRLSGGEFTGNISLPAPMEGKIRVTVGRAEDLWTAKVSADEPVALPRLQTVFSLLDGTGITWDEAESVGTLSIDARISSTRFGEIGIEDFILTSKGEIRGAFDLNRSITFNNRMTIELKRLEFIAMGGEYGLTMKGGFSLPAIAVDKLQGTISIAPGPEITVTLDEVKIEFESSPVKFVGELAYSGNQFRGSFDIGIGKVLEKGIRGTFIAGTQAIDEKKNFTYWYVEMSVGTAVALGSTGLSLLELGGGVGWNYDPPVGERQGAPRNSGALSFKAIVGIGNFPSGELFAGRMTMILTDSYFTLNGKAWLLKQEENMFGEGELTLHWSDDPRLEGFVRMFIGLPDAEGGAFYFNGRINFLYGGGKSSVRSEKIEGSVLKQVKAEAVLDVTSEHVKMEGTMWYDLNRSFPLGIVSAVVDLHVSVDGRLEYLNATRSCDARLAFVGTWDLNLETTAGMFDIVSGAVELAARATADPSIVMLTGTLRVTASVLWFDVDESIEVGYTTAI